MIVRTGGCLCGAVRYRCTGPENWCCHCHCRSCRKATASPFTTFFGMPRAAVTFSGAEPGRYASSPGVRRSYCRTCGTPLAYETEADPGEIHLYAATLDDPQGVTPAFHSFWAEKLDWIAIDDGLPRHPGPGVVQAAP